MKLFSSLLVAATLPALALGWWDNGHMLVGEVATQLMDAADVATINSVLYEWDDEFTNTSTITTTAVWPDMLKCTATSTTCRTAVLPSLTFMDVWHYVNLPYYTGNTSANTASLALFDEIINGESISVLEKSVTAFKTTKSNWAANFALRNFIHIFGDSHQPMHVLAAVNDDLPGGDAGGNYYPFASPCGFSNIHAIWDAAGGDYSQNNWDYNIDSFAGALAANATQLIGLLGNLTDPIDFAQYAELSWSEFATAMVSGKALRYVLLDSYTYAPVAYDSLDLTFDSKSKIPCPSQSYVDTVKEIAKERIALGGQRLAVILTQFAAQLRSLGLAK